MIYSFRLVVERISAVLELTLAENKFRPQVRLLVFQTCGQVAQENIQAVCLREREALMEYQKSGSS